MIMNRTLEFNKLSSTNTLNHNLNIKKEAAKKDPAVEEYASCDYLRAALERLDDKIFKYKQLQNLKNLPSFKENVQNKENIENTKVHIDELISKINKEILVCSNQISHKPTCETMRTHFTILLEKRILSYRHIVADNIQKTTSFEILNNIMNNTSVSNTNTFDCQEDYLTKNSNDKLTQNLMSISNTLLELKMTIKQQDILIDSLDRYFENSNRYLELANNEIRKIPKTLLGIKDKTIKTLTLVIVILLTLLAMKEYKKKHKKD